MHQLATLCKDDNFKQVCKDLLDSGLSAETRKVYMAHAINTAHVMRMYMQQLPVFSTPVGTVPMHLSCVQLLRL